MIDYGLKDRVVLITGVNNPQGIGAATALAFAREGAKLVLVYKRVLRPFDAEKTDRNGADRYYAANAGDAGVLENRLREIDEHRPSHIVSHERQQPDWHIRQKERCFQRSSVFSKSGLQDSCMESRKPEKG